MYSFPRVNGEPNTIGYSRFYFIPTRNVVSVPRALGKVILQDIVANTEFYAGYSIYGLLKFKDDPQKTPAGNKYPVEIEGVAPVDKPEYLALFEEMVDDEFLVIIEDLNKNRKLCGTIEKGMKFIYKTEGVGYTFRFYGEYSEAPSFYFGQFIVDSQVMNAEFIPGTIYTVGGYWLFGDEDPVPGIGKDGDGFFNHVAQTFYEKQGNTWVYLGYLGPDQELEELALTMSYLNLTGNM